MNKYVHKEEPPSKEASERRREIILAGHGKGNLTNSELIAFLNDDAPELREAALNAVLQLDLDAEENIFHALSDEDQSVRRRALELVVKLPSSQKQIDQTLLLLKDPSSFVVEMACWVIGEIGDTYRSTGELVSEIISVASEHDDSLCREAAVACLGSLGHVDGLPAILAALEDKPNVRRRATLALAPFEGPEVDEALKRKLEDRDLQTRQAAEDLLS